LGYLGGVGQSEVPAEEKIQRDKEKSDYNDRLNLALKQQREGNYEASIKTSEELLKAPSSPPNIESPNFIPPQVSFPAYNS
jgi:hypothetical protein